MLAQLAARIDAAAWADIASTPEAVAVGAHVVRLGDATLVVNPGVDHMLFNRAFQVPAAALSEVVRVYRDHGVSRWMLHVPDGEQSRVTASAEAWDMVWFHRPWAKLARPFGPVAPPQSTLEVVSARPEDADAIGALFRAGFDLPATAASLMAALVGRPNWEVLIVRDGSGVAGLGLAFDAYGGTALEGGVTAATHRGRGIQGAVMQARVARAFARGATWVSSETGVAVPGQPNSSWRNMERCGLRQVGLWHNLVPRGTRW